MEQALSIGPNDYDDLDDWLSAPISDSGHYVEQHLRYDADRLHPCETNETNLHDAKEALKDLVNFCELNTGCEPSLSCYQRAIDDAKRVLADMEGE